MQRIPSKNIWLPAFVMFSLAACGGESVSTATSTPDVGGSSATSPGKPSAPISISYEVLGKPIVGLPVAINVQISASQDLGPVSVRYSITDTSAMLFQEGQIERREYRDVSELDLQQIAVVPQREGRLYINVSAEVQTPGGSMIKSMAIPIQVGSAPSRPQTTGELVEGPDGETVISLPAQ